MKFIIFFYLVIILLLLYPVINFSQFLKERSRLRKKAIKNFEVKFSINLISSVIVMFFSLILLIGSGYAQDLYAYSKAMFLSIFFLILLFNFYCRKIFNNILITEEGLFILRKLIKWVDVESINEGRYFINIKIKVRFFKNRRINKILYNITQNDIMLIKKLVNPLVGLDGDVTSRKA